MERNPALKDIWGREKFFILTLATFTLSILILFFLSIFLPLRGWVWWDSYFPKPGLIIGAFYPIISFSYYYRYYLKAEGMETTRPSLLSWVLPALTTHFIVFLGFYICLMAPTQKYSFEKSFFSGYYQYATLFNEFQKMEKEISGKQEKYSKEISKFYNRYQSYLKPDKDAKACPPEAQSEDSAIGCLKNLSTMAPSINVIPFYLALSFGFLGALIYSLSDLISRYNKMDLYPKNFVFYTIRFIIAGSLCTTLAGFIISEWSILLTPVVFFTVGYFPDRALRYLDQKMTGYLGDKTDPYQPLPLSLVQGLTEEKAFRLREMGIEDLEHLAVADVRELQDNLPYNTAMLCDWIGQSILILYFSKKIDALRNVGVRTILDLQNCLLEYPEKDPAVCAKKIGLDDMHLRHVAKNLDTNYMKGRLKELKACLGKEY